MFDLLSVFGIPNEAIYLHWYKSLVEDVCVAHKQPSSIMKSELGTNKFGPACEENHPKINIVSTYKAAAYRKRKKAS